MYNSTSSMEYSYTHMLCRAPQVLGNIAKTHGEFVSFGIVQNFLLWHYTQLIIDIVTYIILNCCRQFYAYNFHLHIFNILSTYNLRQRILYSTITLLLRFATVTGLHRTHPTFYFQCTVAFLGATKAEIHDCRLQPLPPCSLYRETTSPVLTGKRSRRLEIGGFGLVEEESPGAAKTSYCSSNNPLELLQLIDDPLLRIHRTCNG